MNIENGTEVSSPTRVAQAHRIAYHQSLGSPQKIARHSFNGRDNDCVTKNEASATCKKKLFDPPSVVVATQVSSKLIKGKEKGCSRFRKRIRGPVIHRRYNLQKIVQQFHPSFGPYITEFIRFKIQKKKRYTPLHKWMAINVLVNCSISGYNLLRRMFPLPSPCTVLRALRANKMNPGSFIDNYAKIASASLMRAPLSANCQTVDDQLELTVAHFFEATES
ncbi:hypothetical protein FHG87_016567 [Trinorchestia longiramus]|nr:hypothetical protein FHG87_016567 [Trinorchestia longiramus]